MSIEQAAFSIVNPITVIGMYDKITSRNHKTIIQTAAFSSIGKMIQRYFTKKGIKVINIVRKNE